MRARGHMAKRGRTNAQPGSAVTEAEATAAALRALLERAPAAICILQGPELVFTLANERTRALVGGRDVVGQPLREALPQLVGSDILATIEPVIASGEPFVGHEVPIEMAHPETGAPVLGYFNFVYQPMRGADGG